MRPSPSRLGLLLLLLAQAPGAGPLAAADLPAHPSVLLVTAHPDDETMFAGTVFAITRSLAGSVDLAVVTNGEGGYRFATLAEPIYGLKLSDEAVARASLPRIRQRELLAAGAILGIRRFFFLDQADRAYTEDAVEVLARQWDAASVVRSLRGILARGRYEFVIVPLPTTTTHGAHQAAALLALEAAASLPEAERPALLGATDYRRGEPPPCFAGRSEHPSTRVLGAGPVLEFDRSRKLGYAARLDYRIVVNWVIAEHKSQGLTQTQMNAAEVERFFVFALSGERGAAAAQALFARLGEATGGAHARAEASELPYGRGVCPPPR